MNTLPEQINIDELRAVLLHEESVRAVVSRLMEDEESSRNFVWPPTQSAKQVCAQHKKL